MEKPRLTIGCIGHEDHGKTSLMIAMAGRAKAKGFETKWQSDYGIEKEKSEMVKKTEDSLKKAIDEIYRNTKK